MSIIIWTVGILATWAVINTAIDGMEIAEEDMNNGHY